MRRRYEHEAPVPADRVADALFAVDEYDTWSSMARRGDDGLRWRVPLRTGGSVELGVRVEAGPAGVLLAMGGPRLRFEHRIEIAPRRRDTTRIIVSTTVAGPLRGLARCFDVGETARVFCHDLTVRSFWLRQAPDADYPHLSPGLPPRPGGRNASLEQLEGRTRELEGGMLVAETGTSCVLIDLAERRFMRAPRDADLARLAAFGRWRHFTELFCDGDDIVIVPEVGAPPLRVRTGTRSQDREAGGAPARGRLQPVDAG
jgi:hypothetical protein